MWSVMVLKKGTYPLSNHVTCAFFPVESSKTPQEKRHMSQIFIKDMCLFSRGVFIYI